MLNNTNSLDDYISSFKTLFNGVINLGISTLWDGIGKLYSKDEYHKTLKEKRNQESEEELEGVISGNQYYALEEISTQNGPSKRN